MLGMLELILLMGLIGGQVSCIVRKELPLPPVLFDIASLEAGKSQVVSGKSQNIVSLAFSTNSEQLVFTTGYPDKKVKVLDLATRKIIKTLGGATKWAGKVAVFPDGERFAVAIDNQVRIYGFLDLEEKEVINPLKPSDALVDFVSFFPAGKHVVFSSRDKSIRVRNLLTGKEVAHLFNFNENIFAIDVSSDSQYIAVGDGRVIRVFETEKYKEVFQLKGHKMQVTSLSFSPWGKTLVSGSYDRVIKIWGLPTRQELSTIRVHSAPIYCVRYSPDGLIIASSASDGTIHLFDANKVEPILSFAEKAVEFHEVALSKDGRYLAAAGNDGNIRIWTLGSNLKKKMSLETTKQ